MDDLIYMQRCLELAKNGLGTTSPNPLVGSVVVCDGKIIGEGWHHSSGKPHAEVNALASVTDKDLLSKSTLYVNLEPCSHHGKTPPCANLILEKSIPKVVIGSKDPNPEVSGRGIKLLRENGVEVIEGVMGAECDYLNRRFFTFHQKERPYIILKWAQSADGFVDSLRTNTERKAEKISGRRSGLYVHQSRSEEDAILIGTNTALLDNPSLTTRYVAGKNPVRLVIDKDLKIPSGSKIFSDESQTILYNLKKRETRGKLEYYKFQKGKNIIEEILQDCYRRNFLSLMVEGGPATTNTFLKMGLWDEARIIISNKILGKGLKAAPMPSKVYQIGQKAEDQVYIFHNS